VNQAMKRFLAVLLLTASGVAQTGGQPKPDPAQAIKIVRELRDHVADRDSFRVNSVIQKPGTSKDGAVRDLCVEYRSKNERGCYELAHFFTKTRKSPDGPFIWPDDVDLSSPVWEAAYTAFCRGLPASEGQDLTDEVKAALKADREKE